MRRLLLLAAFGLFACTTGGTELASGPPAPSAEAEDPISASIELPEDIASISGPGVAIDGGGAVHLIWADSAGNDVVVRHALATDASVGDPEVISDPFDLFLGDPTALTSPTGEVCAFVDAFVDEADPSTEGFYMRCQSGPAWSEPESIAAEGLTTRFDPAFDAEGIPRAAGTTPVTSVTYEGQELSEDDDTAGQVQLEIDAEGRYHVVWYEIGDPFELNHRVSEDDGATWSETEAIEGTEFFVPDPTLAAASDGSLHLFYETAVLFHRVWTEVGGWGALETGPDCGGDHAFALAADDVPVAACANLGGVHLTAAEDGTWSELRTIEGSTDVPAGPVALAVGPDGTRHVLWVEATDPPSLRYAAVPVS